MTEATRKLHLLADASVLEFLLSERAGFTNACTPKPPGLAVDFEGAYAIQAWSIKHISPNRLTT